MLWVQRKHSYYDQREWTHRLQWQPACFAIWMMKLMYGPHVCPQQPQSFSQVMNSINTVGYWKRPGHTRSHLNSSFQFSPFSHFGTSQINWTVFLFVLSLLSLPFIYILCFFCATFNDLKGMQEWTGNTWQSTFERLRLTNGTMVSSWLCIPPTPLFFCSICLPKPAATEMSIAIEARLESDVNWAGDWFVDWKWKALWKQRKDQGTDEQWERRSQKKSQCERKVLLVVWRIRMIELQSLLWYLHEK